MVNEKRKLNKRPLIITFGDIAATAWENVV
jgi:hypothetical protein